MKEYKLFEDFFLGAGFILVIASVAMRLLGVEYDLGFTTVTAKDIFAAAITCLLFNLSLNIQNLVKAFYKV